VWLAKWRGREEKRNGRWVRKRREKENRVFYYFSFKMFLQGKKEKEGESSCGCHVQLTVLSRFLRGNKNDGSNEKLFPPSISLD
jgi:hypothetical protein